MHCKAGMDKYLLYKTEFGKEETEFRKKGACSDYYVKQQYHFQKNC